MPAPSIALIAPYLSPGSIGPRAARSRRLAEALADAGYRVRAIVVDTGRLEDMTAEAEVFASAPGPVVGWMGDPGMDARRQARASVAENVRRVLPLPDAHIRWATALARDPALASPPPANLRAIYAVAVPFSSLVLAAVLGSRWGVPVFGDLGDPWPDRGPAESALARWTLGRLDALVVTNERTAHHYEGQIKPGGAIVVAPNGADTLLRADPEEGELPLFLQLGTLSHLRVDPAPAFRALAALDAERCLQFRSHGEAWIPLTPQTARHHLGVIPEDEARDLMRAATALIVVGNRNAIQIPSKVYEVARSDLWALCVSELDREPGAELLRASGHGVVTANTEAGIRAAALEILARDGRGERPSPSDRYSWEGSFEPVLELIEAEALPDPLRSSGSPAAPSASG